LVVGAVVFGETWIFLYHVV